MLIFRLALRLCRTVDELENTMDEEELYRWMVFDAIEPIGDRRQDTNAAFICAAQHGGKPSDFMPQWDQWLDNLPTADESQPTPDAQTLQQIQEERQLIAFKAEINKLIRQQAQEES